MFELGEYEVNGTMVWVTGYNISFYPAVYSRWRQVGNEYRLYHELHIGGIRGTFDISDYLPVMDC